MSEKLAHALAYPFAPPRYSFHLSQGDRYRRIEALAEFTAQASNLPLAPLCGLSVQIEGVGMRRFDGRVPVIAAGSNASPARLRTKFLTAGVDADFPVVRARVKGLVPVYSAHISKYGSIPGTLTAEPGACSMLSIAFLTKVELNVINDSEAIGKNYGLALLTGIDARLSRQIRLDRVLAYVSKRGAFAPAGQAVRISSFRSSNSELPTAGQRAILHHARRTIGSSESLEAFVLRNIHDDAERQRRTDLLARNARPCRIPGLHTIAGGLEGPQGCLPDF